MVEHLVEEGWDPVRARASVAESPIMEKMFEVLRRVQNEYVSGTWDHLEGSELQMFCFTDAGDAAVEVRVEITRNKVPTEPTTKRAMGAQEHIEVTEAE
jgi:hypothetical protein